MAKQITAKFHPQAWQNDYALELDPEGENTWDVTAEVLALGEQVAREIRDDQYESDEFKTSIHAPAWVREWSGPFWIEIEQSIADYFDNVSTT